jgi:hypothetical protein
MRKTDAARNTQELLDKTVQRVVQSSAALRNINNDFDGIVESATDMGEKIASISSATKELSKGIEEITKANLENDKSAQQEAAISEQTAAASQELTAQAEELKLIVFDLSRLVLGTASSAALASRTDQPDSNIRCWEIKNCPPERHNNCPAYPSQGNNCWMVTATLCGGKEQGTYKDKMENCRKCNVYELAHQSPGGRKKSAATARPVRQLPAAPKPKKQPPSSSFKPDGGDEGSFESF